MNPVDLAAQEWPAPAKLNLFLHIVGQREDGYYLLQSAIQFIDLCDQLRFTVRADGDIQQSKIINAITQEDDLSIRAAKLLQKTCAIKQGITIELNKVIPMGAGLGGGSSDAATSLLALNQIWECGLNLTELEVLAGQLGADVPVFVRGAASWVEGIGQQLEPVTLPEPWYVVVFPHVHLDTQQMFSNPDLIRNCVAIKMRDFVSQSTQNVFEPIARQQPEVERAFQWLNRYSPAKLTGSGSGLFAVCGSQQQVDRIVASCPQQWSAYGVKGLNRSPVLSRCEYN